MAIGQIRRIPYGWRGTKRTLEAMTDKAAADAKKWNFIKIVSRIVASCPDRDQVCELHKMFAFVKRYVRFIPDPRTKKKDGYVELVQAPFYTLDRRAGDCDDMSVLLAAMAMAIGMPARFVAIVDPMMSKTEFSHVYAAAKANGQWTSMDASVKTKPLGWEPPRYVKRLDWRI